MYSEKGKQMVETFIFRMAHPQACERLNYSFPLLSFSHPMLSQLVRKVSLRLRTFRILLPHGMFIRYTATASEASETPLSPHGLSNITPDLLLLGIHKILSN